MTAKIDLCLNELDSGLYDIQIDSNGDFLSQDFFDTAILVSIFAEKRATKSQIPDPSRRRGWIGNEATPNFEIGSHFWLYEQSRLTQNDKNGLQNALRQSLKWLIDDKFAISIDNIIAINIVDGVNLEMIVRRPNSKVEKRHYTLWNNTAVECPDIPLTLSVEYVPGMNLFDTVGRPGYAVDIIVNVGVGLAAVGDVGFRTGGPWHQDTTLTLALSLSGGVVYGGGGAGGDGRSQSSSVDGAGGGGGAPFGIGGTSTSGSYDGDDGTLSTGGSGGTSGPGATATRDATNGEKGQTAIVLNHDLTIININGVIAGGGGGGGGSGSTFGVDGGDGGNPGFAGTDGAGTFNGDGGDLGTLIETNGFEITWAPRGTTLGDII